MAVFKYAVLLTTSIIGGIVVGLWNNGEDEVFPDEKVGDVIIKESPKQIEMEKQERVKIERKISRLSDDPTNHFLYQKVKLLCIVMSKGGGLEEKAKHIYQSWGRRCNKIIFMGANIGQSSANGIEFVNLDTEGQWETTRAAFKHVFLHYGDSFDWFLRAEDGTFIVVENLRFFLNHYKATDPIYFGCKFKNLEVGQSEYMSNGPGYVLNRESLRRLIEEAFVNPDQCIDKDKKVEDDKEIGRCLRNVGVYAGDSRDSSGRGRFFPFEPQQHIAIMNEQHDEWFRKNSYYPVKKGMDSCSDSSISFHVMASNKMRALEYFLYIHRPFGVQFDVNFDDVTEDVTVEENYNNILILNPGEPDT